MPSTLCCAYLRVYQPPSVLHEARGDLRPPASRSSGMPDGHDVQLVPAAERRSSYSREVEGGIVVCPSRPHLRKLLSLVAAARELPPPLLRLAFPQVSVDDARRQLARLSTSAPGLRACMLQSAWHVPLHWFLCFDPAERRLQHEDEGLAVRFFTPITSARTRLADARGLLGTDHPSVSGRLGELSRWLRDFDDQAHVELDYASVARQFSDDDLADDDSAQQVWEAVRAVGEGRSRDASRAYAELSERWAACRAVETRN